MISYKAMSNNTKLTQYTSIESYKNLEDQTTQVNYIKKLLERNTEGLCDFQIRKELIKKGVNIPLSTVSARRNDINKESAEQGRGHLVVNINQEKRLNPSTKKSCLVWRINNRR